jgi:hypothetical protein
MMGLYLFYSVMFQIAFGAPKKPATESEDAMSTAKSTRKAA